MIKHQCSVTQKKTNLNKATKFQRFILISPANPLRLSYFRSQITVRKEQIRQLETTKYIIHPFSKFRAWYETYLVLLYGSVLITKPMDAAFVKTDNCANLVPYVYYNILTDILCWIDIVMNFFTGYEISRENRIELNQWNIAKRYVLGPFFISDLISSIPKCLLYHSSYLTHLQNKLKVFGVAAIIGLFKMVRIVSFMKCIWRTTGYWNFKSQGVISLASSLFGCLMVVHWLACMQFAVPRLFRISFAPILYNNSWFFSDLLYNGTLYDEQNILIRYNHGLFKSSAYILGIRMILYNLDKPEEYVLAVITYFIGKVLVAFVWIILALAILNSRIMEIKFAEIMDQLAEYMRQKQLPLNVQDRILQHYLYRYGSKYFKEQLILNLLSEKLRKEANLHICKSLIQNVSLFDDLTPLETSKIVNFLIPVIFLPNDTIIHAGAQGDAMYFISTGTVAVYTRSGMELCHLQDGAYFGEISLVLKDQFRTATIKALETSHLFRLNKKDLERYLLCNKSVMIKILKNAEERLKEVIKADEAFKEVLFKESFGALDG